VAARIVDAVGEPVLVAGEPHAVSVSVGVALAAVGDDPADALRDADRAMYHAKDAGRRSPVRGRHQLFDDLGEGSGSARAGVR
jgi:GGDEF domain-containing protein